MNEFQVKLLFKISVNHESLRVGQFAYGKDGSIHPSSGVVKFGYGGKIYETTKHWLDNPANKKIWLDALMKVTPTAPAVHTPARIDMPDLIEGVLLELLPPVE